MVSDMVLSFPPCIWLLGDGAIPAMLTTYRTYSWCRWLKVPVPGKDTEIQRCTARSQDSAPRYHVMTYSSQQNSSIWLYPTPPAAWTLNMPAKMEPAAGVKEVWVGLEATDSHCNMAEGVGLGRSWIWRAYSTAVRPKSRQPGQGLNLDPRQGRARNFTPLPHVLCRWEPRKIAMAILSLCLKFA